MRILLSVLFVLLGSNLAVGAASPIAPRSGATPLITAAENGHLEAVELLLEAGVDVNKPDKYGQTPLLLAVFNSNEDEDIAKLLIQYGADVNKASNRGESPLSFAAGSRNHELSKLLIECGADVNVMDMDGYTPLHRAAYYGDTEFAQSLVAKGAKAEQHKHTHEYPFSLAMRFHDENIELLKILNQNSLN
ncbi:MAG: ankyrin repeat domain-containing protein [Deltaproteobacteria bacterium]|nr:ankyrin repeat domain-containing protein [Deltaproteobacteria bacterium]